MTVKRGETSMLGRVDTGSALGSGAVDADFWALVCEDEEWLDAEFDAIVSAAWEAPERSGGHSRVELIRTGRGIREHQPCGIVRPWRKGERPGRRWRWERGPPGTGSRDISTSA